MAILIYVIGFVYDAVQEMLLIRAQLYIYSQVIPFGSVFTGKPYQFPLLWESSLVTAVMIPAGVLLYRDDTGRTVAEKLSQRVRAFDGRPVLGTFVVMFLVLNAAYLFIYGGSFAIIRGSGAATSVACPWPVSRSQGLRPPGLLREGGPARSVFRRDLGRVGDGTVGASGRQPTQWRRPMQSRERKRGAVARATPADAARSGVELTGRTDHDLVARRCPRAAR